MVKIEEIQRVCSAWRFVGNPTGEDPRADVPPYFRPFTG
jgi:hypothetical protein